MSTSPALFDSYAALGSKRTNDWPKTSDMVEKDIPEFNGRLCDITQNWKSDKERGECFPTVQLDASRRQVDKQFESNSLLLRRNVYPVGTPPQLQLEIQSDLLQDVFRKLPAAVHLRTINIHANPIVIKAPYYELYYVWSDLAHEVETTASHLSPVRSERLRIEREVLNTFIDENLGAEIEEAKALVSVGQITAESLWAVFEPGEMIVLRRQDIGGDDERSCGVLQTAYAQKHIDGKWSWSVTLRQMGFEGGIFGTIESEYSFPLFAGQRPIAELPICPLRHCIRADVDKITSELETRGRTFIDLCQGQKGEKTPVHKAYDGPIWIQNKKWDVKGCEFFDPPERMISGRVMIDPEGYKDERSVFRKRIVASNLHTESRPRLKAPRVLSGDTSKTFGVTDVLSLTRDELMTFPSRIAGYSLVTKDAGFFQVNRFKSIDWEDERVKHILEKSSKMRSVRRVASGFSFQPQRFNYGIENKGKGLVILLHGPPGTGKTLTGECVSEALRLPLYRVGGMDIGIDAEKAEPRLTTWFDRASRWGAVMLIDEADAFMTKRSEDSLERNALASVLLRLLEYQSGIVILTTNLKSHFDKAFHSRIHVTVEYDNLTRTEQSDIWRWEIQKAGFRSLSPEALEQLSQLGLSGRVVKNVVHVLKLWLEGGGDEAGTSSFIADLKQVLELAAGTLEVEQKDRVLSFCRS